MDEIKEVAQIIGQLGFPAASAGFLLWWITRSLNGKLDRLSRAVEKNTEATVSLVNRLPQ